MVLKVIVIKDNKPVDQLVLNEPTVNIGRKSDCEISIKDPAISGHHARVQVTKDGYLLEDLGSTNGLLLAGKKIEKHVLQAEDLITIGEHQLKIQLADASGMKIPTPASVDEHAGAYLKVKVGSQQGSSIILGESITTVGIPGIQVAAISKRPQGYFIIHVDGGKDKTKTPIVNGEAIGFKSRKLAFGDIIEVADEQLEYCH